MSSSQVIVDLAAIQHNYQEYKKLLSSQTPIMAVVKSNAYGHGMLEVAKFLADKVDILAVVSLEEALQLLQAGVNCPIFVLSFWSSAELKSIPTDKLFLLSLPVYHQEMLKQLDDYGASVNQKIKTHLKVDTGAGRVGVLANEALGLAQSLAEKKFLDWQGVYSHFASSEENLEYTIAQLDKFKALRDQFEVLKSNLSYHIACSAASLVLQDLGAFSLTRLGISLYGLWPDKSLKPHFGHKVQLKPALTWQTKLIHIKKIPAGSFVGYGNSHQVKRDTILGVLPIGYWDGYDRRLGNKGEVIIRGAACPVLGRICMNLTMIDLSDLPALDYNDDVILLGAGQTADQIAEKIGTINYEVVTRINPLIERKYI
ncbi:MAG TPA: alanine racemase [bacterium]|nr:alanine racemase [bacterium]